MMNDGVSGLGGRTEVGGREREVDASLKRHVNGLYRSEMRP